MRVGKLSLTVMTALFMLLTTGIVSVFAFDRSVGCSVEIPVTVTDLYGNIPSETSVTVEISSQNGSPLPSDNKLTAPPNGICIFTLNFQNSGDYEYIIKQVGCSNDKVVLDDSQYLVKVDVVYGSDGKLSAGFSAQKIGSGHKSDDIRFVNVLEKTDPSESLADSSQASEDSSSITSSVDPDDSSVSDSKPNDSSVMQTDSQTDSSSSTNSTDVEASNSSEKDGSGIKTENSVPPSGGTTSGGSHFKWDSPKTGTAVTLGINGLLIILLGALMIVKRKGGDGDSGDR